MSRSKKAHHRLDPDDVLEGRARPNARELLALIHDVNPSGHDLPAREAARRYAQKARLQSLLIHRFPDEVAVEPTDEPGVIGLRHRTSGADACHAMLASLDDDARSWAQRALDLGEDDAESSRPMQIRAPSEPAGPPSNAPFSELSTGELIRRGRAALGDYDYPAARDFFAAATERGNAEAARLLVLTLVENLGLDDEALALEERLDEDALGDVDVRLALAVAAARGDQRERAVRLVRGETGDAAADVFVALARGALERSDLDRALSDVGEIQRRAPSHPALLGLVDTVKKRRADERAPLEAEAQRLLDEGHIDEAEARAKAIAARWPESTVAQAIARAGQEHRRRGEARALAAEGGAALRAGEWARALGVLRRAIAIGLDGAEAAQAAKDLAEAEAREQDKVEADKAAMVVHLIETGHMLRAVTDYLALDDTRRGEILTAHAIPELVYAEQTGVRGAGARQAAQAALALVRAVPMSGHDPAGAMDLIAVHWPVLHAVPDAGKVYSLAHKTAELKAKLAAVQRYSAALVAFDGTREGIVQSIQILSTIRRDDLDDEERGRFDRLLPYMRRMHERMERAVEVGKLRSAGHLVEAREALDALIKFEEAGDGEPPFEFADKPHHTFDWHTKRAEVVRDLARIAGVRPLGAPDDAHLLGVEAPDLLDVPQSWMPGGREIVLAEAHEGWVFLQILDVASGRVTRRASLRIRNSFELRRVQQRGAYAALMGTGICIDIDPTTWEIGRSRAQTFAQGPADHAVLAPGGRFVWAVRSQDGWWNGVVVEDEEGKSQGRSQSEAVFRLAIRPLVGLDEPRVVMVRDKGSITVYEARGAPAGPTHHDIPFVLSSVTVHPSGKGLFALIRDDAGEQPPVRWAELTADGAPVRAPAGEDRTLPRLDAAARCETATALDAGMVFVLGSTLETGARRLLAFAAGRSGIERRFDVEVPPRVTLAQDGAGRKVAALSPHEAGIEVVPLGSEPPRFEIAPPPFPPLALEDLSLAPMRVCAPPATMLWENRVDGSSVALGVEYMQHVDAAGRDGLVQGVLDDPEDRSILVARHQVLWKVPKPGFADHLCASALARYPKDVDIQHMPAQKAAIAGDWAAVRDLLAPLDPSPLADPAAQHHDHLLGAALLMTGDVAEARRVLARGAARRGGFCDLSVLLALVAEDDAPPRDVVVRPVFGTVRVLDRAIREADARLAAGDGAGARRVLAGLVVREAREVQTMARRCAAWLAEPDETQPEGAALDGFARRLALCSFIAAHAQKSPTQRRELPFANARWDTAKLDALAAEARTWMEGDLNRPLPPVP